MGTGGNGMTPPKIWPNRLKIACCFSAGSRTVVFRDQLDTDFPIPELIETDATRHTVVDEGFVLVRRPSVAVKGGGVHRAALILAEFPAFDSRNPRPRSR